jgi:hypothetical protein
MVAITEDDRPVAGLPEAAAQSPAADNGGKIAPKYLSR